MDRSSSPRAQVRVCFAWGRCLLYQSPHSPSGPGQRGRRGCCLRLPSRAHGMQDQRSLPGCAQPRPRPPFGRTRGVSGLWAVTVSPRNPATSGRLPAPGRAARQPTRVSGVHPAPDGWVALLTRSRVAAARDPRSRVAATRDPRPASRCVPCPPSVSASSRLPHLFAGPLGHRLPLKL